MEHTCYPLQKGAYISPIPCDSLPVQPAEGEDDYWLEISVANADELVSRIKSYALHPLMVENSINRYKIGADGSTTIYIQAGSPGKDKQSNWLPAPKAPYYMLFRMYLPDIEALNGQYHLPGAVLVK